MTCMEWKQWLQTLAYECPKSLFGSQLSVVETNLNFYRRFITCQIQAAYTAPLKSSVVVWTLDRNPFFVTVTGVSSDFLLLLAL